jgi:hypothetical protein
MTSFDIFFINVICDLFSKASQPLDSKGAEIYRVLTGKVSNRSSNSMTDSRLDIESTNDDKMREKPNEEDNKALSPLDRKTASALVAMHRQIEESTSVSTAHNDNKDITMRKDDQKKLCSNRTGSRPKQKRKKAEGSDDDADDETEEGTEIEKEDKRGNEKYVKEVTVDNEHSTQEYPNGDVVYRRSISSDTNKRQASSIGWAMMVYRSKYWKTHTIYYKSCLGIYRCPIEECLITERPKLPRGKRLRHVPPMPTKTECKVHEKKLIHVKCDAHMKITVKEDNVLLEHFGYHTHCRPHPIYPNMESMKILETTVRIAPEVTPKQLLLGSPTRKGMAQTHEALVHLGRLTYYRKKILHGSVSQSTIAFIASYEANVKKKMFRSVSMSAENGHIIIQTDVMAEAIQKCMSPLETDSIEGFVQDEDTKNANVTMTSGFHDGIQRTMPFLVSILFGKTQKHYEEHFFHLFESFKFKTFQEFHKHFPGNTCDFSDAERNGFQSALIRLFPEASKARMVDYYRFCEVHFKRTLSRVKRNAAIVDPCKQREFYNDVLKLLDVNSDTVFQRNVNHIKRCYPNATNWLEWHMHPKRSAILFPTLSEYTFTGMRRTTNAQENLGGDFQRSAYQKHLNVNETIDHCYRYLTQFEIDIRLSADGRKLRYERPARTRKRITNDGRPPDTSRKLLSRGQVRMLRSASYSIPSFACDIDWNSYGIPWAFHFSDMKASNTCALDTIMTMIHLLSRYSFCKIPDDCSLLKQCLALVESKSYDEARYVWMRGTTHPTEKEVCETRGIDDAMVACEACKSLFLTSVQQVSVCPQKTCKKKVSEHLLRFYAMDAVESALSLQETLNETVMPTRSYLHNGPLDNPENLPDEDKKAVDIQDVETKEFGKQWVCRGWATVTSSVVLTYPDLLYFRVLAGAVNSNDVPDTLVMIDTLYTLRGIVYHGNNHFTGRIIFGSDSVYYDGLNTPTCKWQQADATPPHGFVIGGLLYSKSPDSPFKSDMAVQSQGELPYDASLDKTSHSSNEQANTHNSDSELVSLSTAKPMNAMMEIKPVGSRGISPTCASCGKCLIRNEMRLLLTRVVNVQRNWTQRRTYHNVFECVSKVLSRDELVTYIELLQEYNNYNHLVLKLKAMV